MKNILNLTSAKYLSLIAILVILPATSVYSQDPAGTDTGQKIGTIVKTAINTALPGVTQLLGLIWPQNDPNRINKAELQTQLEQTRTKLKTDAQSQIKPMVELSDELGVLNQFLDPTVQSYANIISMQTRLSLKETLSDAEWVQQKADWDVVVNYLNKMKNISDQDLQLIKSAWLQLTLSKIRNANLDFVTRMNSALINKDSKNMKDLLSGFLPKLQDVPAIVGFEISSLQKDFKGLSEWAKGAAGPEDKNLTPQQQTYKDFLLNKYK